MHFITQYTNPNKGNFDTKTKHKAIEGIASCI